MLPWSIGAVDAHHNQNVKARRKMVEAEIQMLARGGAKQPLAEGSAVNVGDLLTTGNDARVEITFLDDTKLTLGADAKLTIDTYLYDLGAA
jgi:hypothetical protein